jgi:hypothetical protein
MPSHQILETASDDDVIPVDPDDDENREMTLDEHLESMTAVEDHTFDELMPYTLFDLAQRFPAFHLVEGSWLRAYNLVEQHMEIPYLHATTRRDHYAVSDTQWEL